MKRHFHILCVLAAVSTLASVFATSASAQRTTSPSVRAAARLKNHPPKNWIRHYLGDDRYKIAGGVWKVVSTELDRYYYPAWAPEMLRQSPGIVIGFSSAAEAEEAGYMPSAYPMGNALYGLTSAEILAARQRISSTMRAQAGKRITLSDGKSTVLLPNGWKHVKLGAQSFGTQAGAFSYSADVLTPTNGKSGVSFSFMTFPGNVNAEQFLSPDSVEKLRGQLQQSAGNDARIAGALKGAQLGTGTLGGLRGITMIPGRGAQLPPGMSGKTIIVGRGPKMYTMSAQLSPKDTNYGVIVNSFQPR